MRKRTLWLCCLFCLWLMPMMAGSQEPIDEHPATLSLTPDEIHVGTFYRGETVEVDADIDACDGAAIVFEAGNETVELNRKGRVAGIWLNVAQVAVSNVPQVYILATSAPLDSLCPPETQQELHLGTKFLRRQMKFTSEKPLTGEEFDEFMKLKTDRGGYDIGVPLKLTPLGNGRMQLTSTLPISAAIPPGTYDILLTSFRSGELLQTAHATLTIKGVGFANFMSKLARQHAALYGVMAIVIAMVVGIGMGVVFNSSRGGGH